MCKCSGKCGCNITKITKGEKGDTGAIGPQGPQGPSGELPYLVYIASISQSGTDAPVANVLMNTIGDIVWSYVNEGYYHATLEGAFPSAKTRIITPSAYSTPGLDPSYGNMDFYTAGLDSEDDVFLTTSRVIADTNSIKRQNDALYGNGASIIEIQVYP